MNRYHPISVVLWFLVLTAKCLSASAGDLLVRSWSQGMDVRQQSVQAMLQTRDGYLWIGTAKGLLRFDGVSFTAFSSDNTPGIVGDNISFDALWESDSGVLWAGTSEAGVIRYDHGHFDTFGKEQGLPDSNVLRVDGDDAGVVWIFTSRGVVRWRNGRFIRANPEGEAQLVPRVDGRTLDFDTIGLWRRTQDGLELFSYGAWRPFPTPSGESTPFENDVASIYEDRSRRVWYSLRSQPGRSFCAHNGELTTFSGLPANVFVSYQDRSGYLWMNDHGGHPARWKAGKTYPLPQLQTPFLLNVVEGADGAIWVGSLRTKLFQYRPRLISTVKTAGVPEEGSVLFRQHSGAIWAGGTDLLQLRPDTSSEDAKDPRRRIVSIPQGWNVVRALSEDREGRLLIGSVHHAGGQVLDHGQLLPYFSHGLDNDIIRAMLLTSTGEQWIGTDHGLYRYNDDQHGVPERLRSGVSVSCIAETAGHTVWVGTTEGPLQYQDGHELHLPATAPWKYGEVYAIAVDKINEVWIATSNHGIVRYADGQFRAFSTVDGLPTNTTYSINFDIEGDLWIRSDVGLLRIRRQSIEPRASGAVSKLQVMLLDESDGLPAVHMEPPGNQGFLALDDATLWFATPGGIASLRPLDFAYRAGSPHAVFEEHAIDQSGRLPGADIVLAPGQRNLELHYTALGSRRPEQLTFRYRLRGFDRGWTAAGTRRAAYYTQLPPGQYLFEVQAAEGDDDVWSAAGASAEVRVLTPFYRTWWMKVLACCIALGSLFFYVETRRRVVADRIRMRQAFTHRLIATQEGERKRIAHELHDSLGQHLVLIRTLALLSKPSVSASRGDHLNKIADQAAVAIQEVETISYDLRPYQLDRLGLTKTITSLVEDFESGGPYRVTHSIENIDGFFPKDMEINIYRIVQEALNNILQHAEATEVTVAVTRTQSEFRIVVTDNGRGFVPSASGSTRGGWA